MSTQTFTETAVLSSEVALTEGPHAQAVARILSAAGIECRLVPDTAGTLVLVDEAVLHAAELVIAKRKKDVEEEEDLDDEEEEDEDLEEDEDEDEDFDDDEDEFEEEFDDEELDDDDDDIFYDDDDDE